MEKLEQLFLEKTQFEYREKSMPMATFSFFGALGLNEFDLIFKLLSLILFHSLN